MASDVISQILSYLDTATTRSELGKWKYAEDLSAVLRGSNVDRGSYSNGVPGFYFVCARILVPYPSNDKEMSDEEKKAAFHASTMSSEFWNDCSEVFDEMMGYYGLTDTPYEFPIMEKDSVNGQTGHGGAVVSLITTLSKTRISVEEFAETIDARAVKRGELPPITIPGHDGISFTDHSALPGWTQRGHSRPFQW
ncbi:MAG: hypothetical protein AAB903_03090 [Patescibacteria group bacterium]